MRMGSLGRSFHRHGAGTASLCSPSLSADQISGPHPQRGGEPAYRPRIGPPAQGLELLDGGVGYAGELA